MIAVALSGGADSTAAAVLLHESGERIFGLTLLLDGDVPPPANVEAARALCRRLGVGHRVVDARGAFEQVKDYFCREYLSGRTPNPCVECNREIKFGLLLRLALSEGADALATGHYASRKTGLGRFFVSRAAETKSQEYFLAMLSQEALGRAVFPLANVPKKDALRIARRSGIADPGRLRSRDVCFASRRGYAGFVHRRTGVDARPGPIRDVRGVVLGYHRGVTHYTVGQRKGLGLARGSRTYVLSVDAGTNTVVVGDEAEWVHPGFFIHELNFMKAGSLDGPIAALARVRYRQEAQPAVVHPLRGGGAWVEFGGIVAPGQLAVFSDEDGDVLFAGVIERPGAFDPGA